MYVAESSSFIGFEVYKTSQPFDEAWTCFIQYNKTCKQRLFTHDIFSTDVYCMAANKKLLRADAKKKLKMYKKKKSFE